MKPSQVAVVALATLTLSSPLAGCASAGADKDHLAVTQKKVPRTTTPAAADTQPAKGFCKKDEIKATVKRHAGAIRACYSKRLLKDPSLAGKLKVTFIIGMDGSTKAVQPRSETPALLAAMSECTVATFKAMQFVKPVGGICKVTWPLSFTTQ